MRVIVKEAEPPSLKAHRETPYSDYDNYADKDSLRQALVSEQRGLCCYCMGRIHSDATTMKIEHWQCRSRYSTKQLDYCNLLAACRGGECQPQRLQHCDTRKGDRDLRWNPANPAHYVQTRLRYKPDGSIRSSDDKFDSELTQVLNLNLSVLKNHRKGVLDAILEWWRHEQVKVRGPVPRSRFESERVCRTAGTGNLEPYCQVAVWWLEQRLSRMST